jgi:hypothetical protein
MYSVYISSYTTFRYHYFTTLLDVVSDDMYSVYSRVVEYQSGGI